MAPSDWQIPSIGVAGDWSGGLGFAGRFDPMTRGFLSGNAFADANPGQSFRSSLTVSAGQGSSGQFWGLFGRHDLFPDSLAVKAYPLKVSPRVPEGSTFSALQEWEGRVTEVREDEFDVVLIDLTANKDYATEEATVPMDEVSPRDREKVRPGALLRWAIGDEHSVGGALKRVSVFVFLSVPPVTSDDWKRARSWARKIKSAISVE